MVSSWPGAVTRLRRMRAFDLRTRRGGGRAGRGAPSARPTCAVTSTRAGRRWTGSRRTTRAG